jgi:hypothetical protein
MRVRQEGWPRKASYGLFDHPDSQSSFLGAL